jgi:sugar phosphate isomerase/epimerase
MSDDLEGTLAALQDMGLQYVELAGTYGIPAGEFMETLSRFGLKPSGSHVGIDALETDFDSVVRDSKALENEWIIVPWIAEDRRNWVKLAQDLSGHGERLAGEGLRLAYHNHNFEIGPDQGLRTLLAETHPSLVYFQVDVGWVQFAGDDPAKLLWEFGPRVPLVHLKDMDPARENPHVVAGDGAVQWDQVLAACDGIGVEFGSIEMDNPPADPVEDVRKCVRFFNERGVH